MDKLRDFLKSWPGRILLIFCLSPMVLLGLESYLHQGDLTPDQVAKVGNTAIDLQSLQAEKNLAKERLLEQVEASAINEKSLGDQTLETMINRALLEEQARALGMSVSDDTMTRLLSQDPAFADESGHFSNDLFARFLQSRGMTKDRLFASQRREMNLRQLMNSILTTAIYTAPQVNRLMDLQLESRPTWIKRLDWHHYADQVTLSDDEIARYYDAHKSQMISPNRVDLSYIELSPESLVSPEVTEDELKTAYANYLRQHNLGQKQLSQILLTGDKVNEAKSIIDEMAQGKSFEELAKQYSDDPSGQNGGDIGTYNSLVFKDDASKVDAAIALLEVGQVSEPVNTAFGTHIFKVTGVEQAPSFEELKQTLSTEVLAQKQKSAFADKVASINALVADGYGLKDIANQMNLTVKQINNYQDKGQEVLGQPAIVQAAFDEFAVQDQAVSANIDLGGATLWVQPSNYRASAPMALEDAKASIKQILSREKAIELAYQDAKTQATAISPEALTDFVHVGMTNRQNPVLNDAERANLFATPVQAGQELVGFAVKTATGASVVVGGKIESHLVERMSPAEKSAAAAMMKNVAGQDYLEDYLHHLKQLHAVQMNDELLKTL